MRHLLSVDLEDWYLDVAAVPAITKREAAVAFNRQLEALETILAETGVRCTWFVLGTTAERYPEHVARLHRGGHEIASHGYQHARISELDRNALNNDVVRSTDVLATITGVRPIGYRAPYFSLPTRRSAEVYEVLAAHGYRYSSSTRGLRPVPQAAIREIPTSAVRVAGVTIPFCGGGYWRALPEMGVMALVGAYERRGQQVAAYLHPHELDPEPLAPRRGILRHTYVNLGRRGVAPLLRRLLQSFVFGPYGSELEELR